MIRRGTRRITKASAKSTVSARDMSVHERFKTGEMSQKKWFMTCGPQNVRREIKDTLTKEIEKPPVHERIDS